MLHRTAILIVVAGLVAHVASVAEAAPRVRRSYSTDKAFGLGLMVGAPTGLAAKYHIDGGGMALAFGVGTDYYHDHDYDSDHDDSLHLHADVLWHPTLLASNRSVSVPFYIGLGARVLDHGDYVHSHDGRTHFHDDDVHVGVRVPMGLALDFRRAPIDVFFELVPVVDLLASGHRDFDLTGALGARFYF